MKDGGHMTSNPDRHHRRSTRLKGYDYHQAGGYFVTLCTYERADLFGEVIDGEMRLNEYGQIVQAEWLRTAELRPEVELDAFVVMPNHLHGIVLIHDVGAHGRAPLQPETSHRLSLHRPRRSLGSLMAGFKSAATRQINALRATPGVPVWQRNYNDHVIRNDAELDSIRDYIVTNPARWAWDRENQTAMQPVQPAPSAR
jgi:putative transposase